MQNRSVVQLLEIRNLGIELLSPGRIIKPVTDSFLEVASGEIVCVVGESGCGKSLTALAITRLLPENQFRITHGKILINGMDILGLPIQEVKKLRGRTVSYIFQEPGSTLNPVLRIGTQIMEMLKIHRPSEATTAEVLRLLALVGVAEPELRVKQYPHQLSGGLKQRVAIAMAIASKPQILIADEPTTALDVTIQAEVLGLLESMVEQTNMGLLLITHNLAIAENMAHRIAVLYAGQTVEFGPAEKVLSGQGHPYSKALYLTMPRAGQLTLQSIPGSVPGTDVVITGCKFHPRCPFKIQCCSDIEPELTEVSRGWFIRCHLFKKQGL
jgi:oligopeptide/dipeptide ABC transporter ATP-binding protein